MDMIEINKMTQRKKVHDAEIKLYEMNPLTKDQATTLFLYAVRKQYGLSRAVKIVHGLGIKQL